MRGKPFPIWTRRSTEIRKRGVLRVGVHPGVRGICATAQGDTYDGLEPEIARQMARLIFGDAERVKFVPLHGQRRLNATRSSWLHALVLAA